MHLLQIDESADRIFLIHHGEVETHDQTIFNGQLTVDIAAQGVADLERTCNRG